MAWSGRRPSPGGQMEIRRFDLDSHGLARVVGELQARILEVVWALERPTVKDVTDALGKPGPRLLLHGGE